MHARQEEPLFVTLGSEFLEVRLAVARRTGDPHATLMWIVVAGRTVLFQTEEASLTLCEDLLVRVFVALLAFEIEVLPLHRVTDLGMIEVLAGSGSCESEAHRVHDREAASMVLAMALCAVASLLLGNASVDTTAIRDRGLDLLVAVEAGLRHAAEEVTEEPSVALRAGAPSLELGQLCVHG